jgi:3-hydroxyacyl-CoA dehydrogenase
MSSIDFSVTEGRCVLRLNNPPVNTITLSMLEEFRSALRRANADDSVRSLVITGMPGHFSAGADVGLFHGIKTAEDAGRLSRVFQEAFQEVEDSAKPVAAAVAGKMMGGALELAMACHVRVCERGTMFSMPEVNLGINPGAGGTQRLPRLVGVEAALKMLLTGQALNATEAAAVGLVDEVCDAPDLVACAARLLAANTLRKTRDRTDKVSDCAANDIAFAQAAKRIAGTRPELIAPSVILEAVRIGLEKSFDAGLRAEQELFARCMDTLATRNKIHVFFATRDTAKVPDLGEAQSRPVARVAVIGMGLMGTGIAQAVTQAGLPVIVTDENPAALQNGQERIRGSLQKRVAQGKLSPERAAAMVKLLSATTDWHEVARADLVIEAVFEDVDVKRSVLGTVERLASDETIIASNTSTISLDVLAAGMRQPERFIGLHFFNPAQVMPLLEVIRRDSTAPEAVATALRFAKAIRKTPVLVRNREGFIVNRIFIPYLEEAFWLLEDGADAEAIDQAMVAFGFPMGPLTLTDMAGMDILVHAAALLGRAFPRHGQISPVATTMVEHGLLGQKRGAGVYLYAKGDHAPRRNPATEEILAQVRQRGGKSPRVVSAGEITQRLVLRMVAEAFYVLEEGLVQRESDVDAAMVLGTGFPDFRGGVLKYARDIGLKNVLTQLRILTNQLGDRFAPCNMLNELKDTQ